MSMAKIIEFHDASQRILEMRLPIDELISYGPAKLLFFTGVRYERRIDDNLPKRKRSMRGHRNQGSIQSSPIAR